MTPKIPKSHAVKLPGQQGSAVRMLGAGLVNFSYDAITVDYLTSTTERYNYFIGGTGGTKTGEILVTYTAADKENVLSAVRNAL